MLKVVLLLCVIVYIQAQGHHTHPTHTHHPHPTHPTHVAHTGHQHGSLQFVTDTHSGSLLMISHTHCYLMALTDQQKMDLKDPLKLEMLEIQMSAMAIDTTKLTALTNPDHFVSGHCHGKTIMSLSTT